MGSLCHGCNYQLSFLWTGHRVAWTNCIALVVHSGLWHVLGLIWCQFCVERKMVRWFRYFDCSCNGGSLWSFWWMVGLSFVLSHCANCSGVPTCQWFVRFRFKKDAAPNGFDVSNDNDQLIYVFVYCWCLLVVCMCSWSLCFLGCSSLSVVARHYCGFVVANTWFETHSCFFPVVSHRIVFCGQICLVRVFLRCLRRTTWTHNCKTNRSIDKPMHGHKNAPPIT